MSIETETKEVAGKVENKVMSVRDTTVQFSMERGTSRVLDSVSIDIENGEILGIVGESGSGKSMFASALLNAVVEPGQISGDIRYYRPDGDEVRLLELSKKELKSIRWNEISMVFQGAMSSFNPTISIKKHFLETLDAHNQSKEAGMDHARQLLADLYLDADRVLDSYPHELSGGMRQRALIALSLLLEPQVLVMDEPTAALDLLMQRSILNLILEIQEKYDLTIVFISHDFPLVSEVSDRLAVLYAFEFVEIGPVNDVLRHAAHPYTRALIRAVPSVHIQPDEMVAIEGESPDPVDRIDGCSYHIRCPLATDRCREDDPQYYPVSTTHNAACHHWEEASDAIPFSFETDKSS